MAARFAVLARSFSTSAARQQLVQPPIQIFGMEGRYATALYSAATKKKVLDAVDKDLKEFTTLMKNDIQLKEFILNPLLSKDLKKDGISSVLAKKNASPLTANFMATLIENGRLGKVESIIGAFETIMSALRGEIVCEVITAKPLDAATQKELEATLKAFVKSGQVIKLTTKVDPTIIGGMLVSIGDKYVDMSMSSKINRFTSLLQEAV
ncbi:ATP synthase subunit O, mitochondrial-like [Eriocheir sinensis]|uniref:ATP synthase subunit O, mitochondrial-like n=1 Tax=Eriocheir sinensis TaxID=95602 RepID=UPI0021C7CD93|nr:ATP synthase subunit O, mitochondrial-like [Eriocheir sinensis]